MDRCACTHEYWAPEFSNHDDCSVDFCADKDGQCNCNIDFGSDIRPVIGTANDYALATNKPSINGVTLIGDKSTEELNIEVQEYEILTNEEIQAMLGSAL